MAGSSEPARYWYTVRDCAAALHLSPRSVRRVLQPYRDRCHLAREGRHPRLVLWIPAAVVRELEYERGYSEPPEMLSSPFHLGHSPWPHTVTTEPGRSETTP